MIQPISYSLYGIFVQSLNKKIAYFSISYYSTASTADAVYIIGGFVDGSTTPSTTIARYTMGENWQDCCDYYSGPWAHYDGQWTNVGDLQTKVKFIYLISQCETHTLNRVQRAAHTVVSYGGQHMVIGGRSDAA